MDCKINWTTKAWQTFKANIDYLQEAWTEIEISNFVLLVDKKLDNLSKNPELGKSRNKKQQNIRSTLVHKRVLLIYKYKPLKKKLIY